jgi:hypothetical protein
VTALKHPLYSEIWHLVIVNFPFPSLQKSVAGHCFKSGNGLFGWAIFKILIGISKKGYVEAKSETVFLKEELISIGCYRKL